MPEFRDHFAPQATQYAAFRPTYPADFIAHIATLAPHHDLAWDVGSGSGQAAVLLARHFTRVHATDASSRQLQHAIPHPGVDYAESPADASGLAAGSVDLVTVAQALHWFPQEPFHAEVHRVLKPGGVFAAWSYGLLTVDPAVDAVIQWFYEERIGRYWPPERVHVERRYADLPFPYQEIAMRDWPLDAALTRSQVTGFIATWSAVRHAREAERVDPVEEFAERLARVWPYDDPRAVRWPMVVRAGRRDSAHD